MKKSLVFALILATSAIAANGQCQKKVTWTSEKTEFLDASGKVEDVKSLPTKIETTPGHITVTMNDDVIEGDIKEVTCAWKEAYKNGATSFKSLMAKSNGETRNATVTIEGKDGKIDILVEVENAEGKKMRLLVDNYKEEI
ncbi:MAG TPA: hypothetical protein VFP87_04390 [Chitinophagaceae bacterium]|nr:hypothetical protein [Chitinophagaceae bacterium]